MNRLNLSRFETAYKGCSPAHFGREAAATKEVMKKSKEELMAELKENLEKGRKKATAKEDVVVRGSTGLRLSEFVQISEFFQLYITDFCQISESFAKSVKFNYKMVKKDCSFSQNSLWNGLFLECNSQMHCFIARLDVEGIVRYFFFSML